MLRSFAAFVLLTGSAVSQEFAPPGGRLPDALLPSGLAGPIAFADVDNDGDLDMCAGSTNYAFDFWRRTGPRSWVRDRQFPFAVEVATFADFDRDGDLDLFVASRGTGGAPRVPAGVLRNDGASFTWTGQLPGMLVGTATHVDVGDIDGDGWLDVVVGASSGAQVLTNDGAGGLLPGAALSTGTSWPALYDRDNDGDLDLAIAAPSRLTLFDNVGGTLVATATLPGNAANRVVAADFDVDGRVDLALQAGAAVRLLWNDPAGFSNGGTVAVGNADWQGFGGADLDGDGRAELVMQRRFGADWLRNDGARAFSPGPSLLRGGPVNQPTINVVGLATAPVTGRGVDDLVLAHFDGQTSVFYGSPSGPFADPAVALFVPEFASAAHATVEAGDVDGDGDDDLVVTDPAQVMLQDERGVLRSRPILGAQPSHEAMLHDLDLDGDLDLILLPTATGAPAQRYENDGSGNFTLVQSIALPFAMRRFQFGDVDGDGDVDALSPLGGGAVVFENRGSAGFVHAGYLAGVQASYGYRLLFDDFNGDGNPDVILGENGAGSPIWFGDGAGNYTPGPLIPTTPVSTTQLLALDADGDGDLDLIAGYGQLVLFENDGTGTFAAVPGAMPPGARGWARVADVDGDGHPDVLGYFSSISRTLVLNDGTGSFTDASAALQVDFQRPWCFLDFDGDGDQDVVSRIGDFWQRIPNRLRDAVSKQVPRPGGRLIVEFVAALHAPGPGTVMLPIIALQTGPAVSVPGLAGTFRLPVAGSTLVAVLPAPTNAATWSLSIPAHPSFAGIEICVQGIVFGPNVPDGYTNPVCERILQ